MNKTLKKLVFVSIPATFACLSVAFVLMLLSFEADKWMAVALADPDTGEMSTSYTAQALSFIPSVIYSLIVLIMNQYYLHLAHHLTEWENHRTQEQFERQIEAFFKITKYFIIWPCRSCHFFATQLCNQLFFISAGM